MGFHPPRLSGIPSHPAPRAILPGALIFGMHGHPLPLQNRAAQPEGSIAPAQRDQAIPRFLRLR